jgi:hypothetical protein
VLLVRECEGLDGEQRYISTLSINLATDRGGCVVNVNVVK